MIRRLSAACTIVVAIPLAACSGSSGSRPDSVSDESRAGSAPAAEVGEQSGTKTRGGDSGKVEARRPSPPPKIGNAERTADRNSGRPAMPRRSRNARPSRSPSRDVTQRVLLVQELVSDLIRGLNARDPSICTRLFDQRFVEKDERGAALARCRREIASWDTKLKLVRIQAVRLHRTKAGFTRGAVRFLASTEGRRITYMFSLTRSGGRYRIDAVVVPKQPR